MLDTVVAKPINVRVFGESSTSLRVTWDTGDHSSSSSSSAAAAAAAAAAVTYYRVFYYDVNDLSSAEMDVTVQRRRQAVVKDLCPFCEYSVRVVAYGVDGSSHSSDELTGRTLSDGQFRFCPDDDHLFKRILSNPNHVLAPHLPDKTESHYNLRSRLHDRQLIPKLTKMYNNLIVCMLYKQVYWHSLSFVFVVFCMLFIDDVLSSWVLINGYEWMN